MVLAGESPPILRLLSRARAAEPIYLANEWTWPKRGRRYVRWVRWFSLPRLVRRVARIAQQNQCQAIVGVFPNEYYFYIAYLAAKKVGIPFYPFMHNTYRENRTGIASVSPNGSSRGCFAIHRSSLSPTMECASTTNRCIRISVSSR